MAPYENLRTSFRRKWEWELGRVGGGDNDFMGILEVLLAGEEVSKCPTLILGNFKCPPFNLSSPSSPFLILAGEAYLVLAILLSLILGTNLGGEIEGNAFSSYFYKTYFWLLFLRTDLIHSER